MKDCSLIQWDMALSHGLLSHSASKLPSTAARPARTWIKAASISVAIMDEYAMYEARYLNMDSEGQMALERCIVDIYKAVLTYAAEMKYYIHHRLGISFRSFEEKMPLPTDRIRKAMRAPSESSFAGLKSVIERRAVARSIVADSRVSCRNPISRPFRRELTRCLPRISPNSYNLSMTMGERKFWIGFRN
jgi:hypothetical protein